MYLIQNLRTLDFAVYKKVEDVRRLQNLFFLHDCSKKEKFGDTLTSKMNILEGDESTQLKKKSKATFPV